MGERIDVLVAAMCVVVISLFLVFPLGGGEDVDQVSSRILGKIKLLEEKVKMNGDVRVTDWISNGLREEVRTAFRGIGHESETEEQWLARHDARVALVLIKHPKDI